MTTQAVKNVVINIELKDFPVPGREMVILNEDGSYTIFELPAKLGKSDEWICTRNEAYFRRGF